jgi:TonB family protein
MSLGKRARIAPLIMNRLGLTFAASAILHGALILFFIGFCRERHPSLTPTPPVPVIMLKNTSDRFEVTGSVPQATEAPASHLPGAGKNSKDPTGPIGQIAGHSANENSTPELSYFFRLRDQIQKQLLYPKSLRQRHVAGQVQIELAIDPSGALHSIQLIKSSGHPDLDRLVVESAQAAAPFEPFQGAGPRSALIPIDFKLKTR